VAGLSSTLSATSAALVAKASLVQLSAINTSLSSQLNTVSTFLASKASTTALTAGLAGKQDLLTDSLTLGGLTVSGGDVAFLQHNTGVAFQNDSAQTFAVFEPAGATLGRLVVQGELVASSHYNKTQVDELLGTYAYRLPDGAVGISKVYDLQRQLDENTAIRAAILGQLGSFGEYGVFTRDDLNALTAVVGGKQGTLDTSSALDVASVSAGTVAVSGEVRTSSLNVSGTTSANQITASTITATNVTSTIGAFGKFSSDRIADNGSTLYFAYGDTPFAIRFGKYSSRVGINCDNDSNSGVALECVGAARFSGGVITSDVAASTLTVIHPSTSLSPVTTADVGSGVSFTRFTHGHHIDCYTRGANVGRDLYLNYYANSKVRIGNDDGRLGINCNAGNFTLDVLGTGRFSGALTASNFPSSSDARLKTDVESVSLDECTRLVKAVTPCTYKRIDMEGTPARCGYIAQDWDRELTGGYRSIMGAGEDADGPLLSLDYSRITVLLHGALLSALARLDALESRLQ
jgi:hypothetical protein